ncbi:MAG: cobalt ECF transporter T component CbiQ [Chloroflexi bacterium]|nr:cobalt ECF transporter T component CbiQ [Chloroflexota bacterium]
MHIHFLDPYQHRASPIHALDPRVKFVLALAYILTCALTPIGAWPVYTLLLAMILSVELLSTLGIKYVHRRALLAVPFMLAALPVVFTHGDTFLFSMPIGSWTLTAFAEGLERFASVALKSWLSVQAAVVLAASAPFPDLLQAMRAVRIPRLLVSLFGLMWRYLFVLVDEALRLMRARAARSGQGGDAGSRSGRTLAWRARVTGGMAGNLLLRAFERSDRIYMAMVARGYDGETRSLPMLPVPASAWLSLTGGILLLFLLLMSGFLFWG